MENRIPPFYRCISHIFHLNCVILFGFVLLFFRSNFQRNVWSTFQNDGFHLIRSHSNRWSMAVTATAAAAITLVIAEQLYFELKIEIISHSKNSKRSSNISKFSRFVCLWGKLKEKKKDNNWFVLRGAALSCVVTLLIFCFGCLKAVQHFQF